VITSKELISASDDAKRVRTKRIALQWGRKCESGVQKSDDRMSWFGADNAENEQKWLE
jgi:hypothetical protein